MTDDEKRQYELARLGIARLMGDASEADKWAKVVSQTRADELRNEAVDAGQKSPSCLPTQHSWKEEYYGYKCERCKMFIPYGSEPWLPLDE